MAELYNAELKEEFLSNYPQESATTYRYLFYKTYDTEEMLNKDLYEMTIDELGDVLRSMSPVSSSQARTNGSGISSYISFCIEKGLLISNINPLKLVTSAWYEQFVDKDKKMFITEEELEGYEGLLVNAQDAVIPRLLFEGVNGYEGSELLNLTKKHVDWDNNTLHLIESLKSGEKRERTLEVSDKCMELIRQALEETEYQKKNGISEAKNPILSLINNDYVIRNATSRTSTSASRADKHTIYRRISMISEFFDLPYLRSKNIQRSGMLRMAKDLYLAEGELNLNIFKQIATRYGINKIIVNGYEVLNTQSMKDYINEENLKTYYNL